MGADARLRGRRRSTWSAPTARPRPTTPRQVSSTAIRRALAEGDARRGQPRCSAGRTRSAAWSATATTRGRELGFPTANVAVPDEILLPADGIYAGWYGRPDGAAHPAGASRSAGARRSTTTAHASLLEAHLLDFDGDLYGERGPGRASSHRLRDELKFDSVDALVDQIGRDCDQTRGPPGGLKAEITITDTRVVGEPDQFTDPLVGPEGTGPLTAVEDRREMPRLARSTVTLADGHQVGVAVTGQGIPLVVVHGFSAEGILYAETLSRLVAMGYRVVAIDAAGHGGHLRAARRRW